MMKHLLALLPLALAACQAAAPEPAAPAAAPEAPALPPQVAEKIPDDVPLSAVRQVNGCWVYDDLGLVIPVTQNGVQICTG